MSVLCQPHAPRRPTNVPICRDSSSTAFDIASRLSSIDSLSRVRVSVSSIVSTAFSIESNCFESSLTFWFSCSLNAKTLVTAAAMRVSGSERTISVFFRATSRITLFIMRPRGSHHHNWTKPGSIRSRRFLSSGGAHRVEELADFKLEPVAVAGQRLRRGENLRRGRAGLAGAALHVGDVG
jgi:hypothetical protein